MITGGTAIFMVFKAAGKNAKAEQETTVHKDPPTPSSRRACELLK